MAATLITLPFRPAINLRGGVEAGAKLEVYASGGLTPVQIFSDVNLTTALPNPLTADGFGVFPDVYYNDAASVRVIMKQANGTVLSDTDPYIGGPQPAAVKTIAGTTYTLLATDENTVLRFTSGSAITLTVPADGDPSIPLGAGIEIHQKGVGVITVVAGAGATLQASGGLVSSAGQYAVMGLRKDAANTYVLVGERA